LCNRHYIFYGPASTYIFHEGLCTSPLARPEACIGSTKGISVHIGLDMDHGIRRIYRLDGPFLYVIHYHFLKFE
jgi:hypothetical protein